MIDQVAQNNTTQNTMTAPFLELMSHMDNATFPLVE